MNNNSVFSLSDNNRMESDTKTVLNLLTDLDSKYGKANNARIRQESIQSDLKRYKDLQAKWKDKPKGPNILTALGYGILGGAISFVLLVIVLVLILGFLFISIFGDALDFIIIAVSIGVAVYSIKDYYDSANSEYTFYTTFNASNLRNEYQELNQYVQEYNRVSDQITSKLPPFINTHYLGELAVTDGDCLKSKRYGELRRFLNKYISEFGYNFNAWFIVIQNEKQTREIMRANAENHQKQMMEAYRMRNIAEQGLKNQQEQISYAQQQVELERKTHETEQRTLEIEQEKLYQIKKIREKIDD